ncbi:MULTISPECIES: TPM domain-containing protein [unclassified Bradyrhizobium]|uniref:TPM domain-containing protein n=1 Tax=unclassified Bradyrhizobium TaxID=2631580 RepID=UPI0032EA6A2E
MNIEIPTSTGRVVDQTATLSNDQAEALERKLKDFEKRKGSQVGVLIVPTTLPESIEQYSLRVANQWKLGRKNIDDGVLLTIAMNDRKLRIEVGYGLVAVLDDLSAKRIIDEIIVPQFKLRNFAEGVSEGVDRILETIDAAPVPATNTLHGSELPHK